MNPADGSPSEQRLARLLAAYEEGLRAGDPAGPAAPDQQEGLSPAERDLLRANQEVVRLLRGVAGSAQETRGLTETPPAGPPDAPLPPPRVGRFEIVRELGRGGCGVVYLARDPRLGREVALKVPRAHTLLSPELRRRFLREARASAGLRHPHIVQVYEGGEDGELCYLVCAYCSGGTLAEWLRKQPGLVPPRQAARLLLAVAEAVQHAHEHGVLHRDLKPGNILLEADGEGAGGAGPGFTPLVADFGLAKVMQQTRAPDGEGADAPTVATRAGTLIGTPQYMAPEQTRGDGEGVGPATDVYSLGVVLYELLTGRPPFLGATDWDTLGQVREQEPVPPRRLQPRVPRDLETVCLKCLEKEPARRYPSARELADDLRHFLEGKPVKARPLGAAGRCWRWCRRRPAKAALFAISALVLLVFLPGWAWYGSRLARAREHTQLVERAAEAEHKARASAEEAAWTQEFYRVLFEVKERRARMPPGWTWDNLRDLRRAAGLNPSPENFPALHTEAAAALAGVSVRPVRAVAPGFTAFHAAFTPDGGLLALAQNVGRGPPGMKVLLVDPASGKTVRELAYPSFPLWQVRSGRAEASKSLAISPDGRWLVVGTRSGHLHCWDLRTASLRVATWRGHDKEVFRLAFDPALHTLFSLSKEGELKRWDVARREPLPLPGLPARVDDLAALPARRAVAFLAGEQLSVRDGETLSPLTLPVRVQAARFVPSPGGATVLVKGDGGLHLHEHEWAQHLCILPGSAEARPDDGLAFSPDGRLAAWVAPSTRRLKLWDVAGGRLEADAVVPGALGGVAFHPGGRLLAVIAEGQTLLYELSGGDCHEVKAQQGAPLKDVTFAGDGRTLACLGDSCIGPRRCQVTLWPPGRGQPRHPPLCWSVVRPPRQLFTLAVSPTGSAVCCTSDEDVLCWDRAGGRLRPCGALGKEDELKRLGFGPDGTLWAAVGHEVRCGRPPKVPLTACWENGPAERQAGLVFYSVAAGRRRALAGRRDGRLFLFDAASCRHLRDWRVCDSAVWALALSPDERLALAGTELGKVRLLSLPEGRVVRDLPAHGDCVTGVAFLGRGLLLSASRDATVRLWRADGSPLLTLPAPGPVERVALSPDGGRLAVVVAGERGVRVWHLGRLGEALDRLGLPLGTEPLGRPAPAPRPPALVKREPPSGPNGLKAELFVGSNFERKVKERFDPRVDFDWGVHPADPALPPDFFSVRWTGWLKAPRPGRYVLAVRHDDGFGLWLDGKRVMGNPYPKGQGLDTVEVTLTARPHALRLDYHEVLATAYCALLWRPPGAREPEAIPSAALFHDRAAAEKAAVPARRPAPEGPAPTPAKTSRPGK
jgi:eukaryotic-like serine/threonine-protein kinase